MSHQMYFYSNSKAPSLLSTHLWKVQIGDLWMRPSNKFQFAILKTRRKKIPKICAHYNTWDTCVHTAFLKKKKVLFQRACRIILGPPKHVLHLVWSQFVIFTATRTALKVACKAQSLGKRRSESKDKKIKFGMGPNAKNGVNIHIPKKTVW